MYVYIEVDGAETITAKRESGNQIDLREDCGAVVSVGMCQAGETVDIDIQFEEGQTGGAITAFVYGMDTKSWEQAYNLLDDEILNVSKHSDTSIEGTIDVKENGYFVTSIPYEKGWTIEVDGEERSAETLGGAFLAIPLEAGHHQIRMTYLPDGLIPGILLSLCGIGILIALCFIRRKTAGSGLGASKQEEKADNLPALPAAPIAGKAARRRRRLTPLRCRRFL